MNQVASRVMLEATGQAPKTIPGAGPKNPDAVEPGREGWESQGCAVVGGDSEGYRSESRGRTVEERMSR